MDKSVYLTPVSQNTPVNRLLAPFFPRYRVLLDLEQEPQYLRGALRNLIMTHDRKLLFLRNQKSACTQTTQLLYAYSNHGQTYSGNVHRANRGIVPARYQWRHIKPELAAGTAHCFTFVRHPERRVRSAFRNFFVNGENIARHKHEKPMLSHGYDPARDPSYNFDFFLDYIAYGFEVDLGRTDSHWRLQTCNIGWGSITFDFVGKVESYDADIRKVFAAVGRPDFPPAALMARRFNATDVKVDPVTSAQRRKIETLYAADYAAFGY